MNTVVSCPCCGSDEVQKIRFYRRKQNRQIIQRYLCQGHCKQSFSDQTMSRDYDHKRPDLNQKVLEMVSSGMGIRRMANLLRTTTTIIQRKILFNATVCYDFHRANMSKWKRQAKPRFQMDELETFEEEKGNTIKIPIVIEKERLSIF